MPEAVRVWLSLGSNVEREKHIRAALDALAEKFGALVLSPVYDCAAVGFSGDPFLNLVVGIDTALPVGELAGWLRALEEANGRVREAARRYNDRTLDIDILTCGDRSGIVDGIALPRAEIVKHAFVLRPLADVAPDEKHPALGRSYRELLAQKDFSGQPMQRSDFRWR
ncbi:MAG: 2-amino-4-hydroxy-6-hydroxymethyldihydropteridine diphosphokinase [Pseudomonadota bacterium]